MIGIAICNDCAGHYDQTKAPGVFNAITDLAKKQNKLLFTTSCMGKCSDGKISTLQLSTDKTNEFTIQELTAEMILEILRA